MGREVPLLNRHRHPLILKIPSQAHLPLQTPAPDLGQEAFGLPTWRARHSHAHSTIAPPTATDHAHTGRSLPWPRPQQPGHVNHHHTDHAHGSPVTFARPRPQSVTTPTAPGPVLRDHAYKHMATPIEIPHPSSGPHPQQPCHGRQTTPTTVSHAHKAWARPPSRPRPPRKASFLEATPTTAWPRPLKNHPPTQRATPTTARTRPPQPRLHQPGHAHDGPATPTPPGHAPRPPTVAWTRSLPEETCQGTPRCSDPAPGRSRP